MHAGPETRRSREGRTPWMAGGRATQEQLPGWSAQKQSAPFGALWVQRERRGLLLGLVVLLHIFHVFLLVVFLHVLLLHVRLLHVFLGVLLLVVFLGFSLRGVALRHFVLGGIGGAEGEREGQGEQGDQGLFHEYKSSELFVG